MYAQFNVGPESTENTRHMKVSSATSRIFRVNKRNQDGLYKINVSSYENFDIKYFYKLNDCKSTNWTDEWFRFEKYNRR